jgi:hypothetical protein
MYLGVLKAWKSTKGMVSNFLFYVFYFFVYLYVYCLNYFILIFGMFYMLVCVFHVDSTFVW